MEICCFYYYLQCLQTMERTVENPGSLGLDSSDQVPPVPVAVDRANVYIHERRPFLVVISPGNSYYFKTEVLQKIIDFASSNTDIVSTIYFLILSHCLIMVTALTFLPNFHTFH